jgi:cyclophilin family peptidyl-prolyl cis-trans isomerase
MIRLHRLPLVLATLAMTSTSWAQPAAPREPPPPLDPSVLLATQHKGERPVVIIKTSKGDIKAELYGDKAPITVKNFLQYVDDKFFNHTIFHRVIDGFMVQGGGFNKDMSQKPTRAPIKNEAENGEKNVVGTLAMARTPDVDSATAQFFINIADNEFLNFKGKSAQTYGYCVFGKVVDGMDVVNAIKSVPTGNSGPYQNVPVEPIEILEIVRAP